MEVKITPISERAITPRALRAPGDIVISTLADRNNAAGPWSTSFNYTIGQSFTAPGNRMVSMSFYINNISGSPFDARAYVYAWTGTQVVGPALFVSPTFTVPAGVSTLVTPTTGLDLVIGDSYIAFYSTLGETNPPGLTANFGAVVPGTYSGGYFAFNLSPTQAGWYTPWGNLGLGNDLAFEFIFRNRVPCLHPSTKVLLDDGSEKAINEIKSGDQVLDLNNKPVEILYNMCFDKSDDFIKIEKDALGTNLPIEDTFIRKGHLILLNGKPTNVARLKNRFNKVRAVNLENPVPTWSLCTKRKTYVKMQGLLVSTWCEKEILQKGYTFQKY
jgi:hypothetical protein